MGNENPKLGPLRIDYLACFVALTILVNKVYRTYIPVVSGDSHDILVCFGVALKRLCNDHLQHSTISNGTPGRSSSETLVSTEHTYMRYALDSQFFFARQLSLLQRSARAFTCLLSDWSTSHAGRPIMLWARKLQCNIPTYPDDTLDWLHEPRDPHCNMQLQTSLFKPKGSFMYPILDCVPYLDIFLHGIGMQW